MKSKSTQKESEFDKDVPIPEARVGRLPNSGRKWKLSEMEVGDSKPITEAEKNSIYSCVVNYNKTHKASIKIRTGKDGDGVLRFWRIE